MAALAGLAVRGWAQAGSGWALAALVATALTASPRRA